MFRVFSLIPIVSAVSEYELADDDAISLIQLRSTKHSDSGGGEFDELMDDLQDPSALCRCDCAEGDALNFAQCCMNGVPEDSPLTERLTMMCQRGNPQMMASFCARFGVSMTDTSCSINDEASAIGDPHLSLATGEKVDLCCETGVCVPCPVALIQETNDFDELVDEASSELQDPSALCRCDCGEGDALNFAQCCMNGVPEDSPLTPRLTMMCQHGNPQMMASFCARFGVSMSDTSCSINDEASAVGDPHLSLATGEKVDLCCETGVCVPCPAALIQETDDQSGVVSSRRHHKRRRHHR